MSVTASSGETLYRKLKENASWSAGSTRTDPDYIRITIGSMEQMRPCGGGGHPEEL
ncbi:MAG: hypothetical protein ACLTYN_05040 [Dysosmobacter welbionis]